MDREPRSVGWLTGLPWGIDMRRALSDPDRLATTATLVSTATRAEARLAALATQAAAELDGDAGFVAMCTAQGLNVIASSRGVGGTVPLSGRICPWVVATGQPILIDDVLEEARRHNRHLDIGGMHAYAGAPLITRKDTVVGALAVVCEQPRQWDDSHAHAIGQVASEISALLTR
jgi:GAF domain-containing protein